MVLVGSQGRMVLNEMDTNEPIKLYKKGYSYVDDAADGEANMTERRVQFRDGDILSPLIKTVEPLTEQVMDFLSAIHGERIPIGSAQFAVNVVRILEAADMSIAQDGKAIFL